jgi:5-methylthioadenosine/S-adenosylhomocysteine deaminase
MRRGVRVGLGTDGAISAGTLDMFRVVHAGVVGQQAIMGTPSYHRGVVSQQALFEVATMGGARSLSMDKEIGSLEVGKRADIILLDKASMDQFPDHDPLYTLSACSTGRDVRTVIIDGDIVMRDRQLMHIDQEDIKAQLQARLPSIMERFEAAMAHA